ncbi:MAG: hypothetical protein ACI4GB_00380 [Acutalibacteraceae bacterium]
MRIAEIEKKLSQDDCSDEMIKEFISALKRVPRTHRCQHCYATAVSMNPRFFEQAIALIHYGLEFCDRWSDEMRAYCNMAIIYENHNDYPNALLSYDKALNAIPPDIMTSYIPVYSSYMLRAEMHINHFEYTDQLRHYYDLSGQADEFSQSFLKTMFYRALAEIIIFSHDGNISEMKNALEKADSMLCPNYTGPLTALLKRKGYIETIGATKESIRFLKKAKKDLR